MSIICGYISAREAVLAVDTLGRRIDGTERVYHTSKCWTIPHVQAVFATRGTGTFPAMFQAAVASERLDSIDDLLAMLPDLLQRTHAASAPMLAEQGLSDATELVVVGWSAAQNRPIGAAATNMPDGQHVSVHDVADATYRPDFRVFGLPDGAYFMPNIADADRGRIMARWKQLDARERVTAIAKVQVDGMAESHGRGHAGGRLLMTTLTRNAVETRTVHQWAEDAARETTAPAILMPRAA